MTGIYGRRQPGAPWGRGTSFSWRCSGGEELFCFTVGGGRGWAREHLQGSKVVLSWPEAKQGEQLQETELAAFEGVRGFCPGCPLGEAKRRGRTEPGWSRVGSEPYLFLCSSSRLAAFHSEPCGQGEKHHSPSPLAVPGLISHPCPHLTLPCSSPGRGEGRCGRPGLAGP